MLPDIRLTNLCLLAKIRSASFWETARNFPLALLFNLLGALFLVVVFVLCVCYREK